MSYVLLNLHWFIILIGALVFVHELGHFVLAKLCGVKVHTFSLGFGPRVLGFTRGETEYRISLLPLGGYVKMLGENPMVPVQDSEKHRAFMHKPVWQRAAIVAAGPLFNLVLAFFVYAVMFYGTNTFGSTRLGVVSRGGPAWQAGLRPGDRITSVSGVPIEHWDELPEHIGPRPDEEVSVGFERKGETHTVVVRPEAFMEPDVFDEPRRRGRIGISLQYIKPVIGVIDFESPAAKAGLQDGDTVLMINGASINAWHELRDAIAGAPAAEPVRITYRRDGRVQTVTITPAAPPVGLDPELFSSADPVGGYTGLVNLDTRIAAVEPNTPAELVGLQVGDRLLSLAIEKPNGEREKRPIGVWGIDLAAFSGVDARSNFTLTVQRGRDIMQRGFKLDERKEQDELKNVRRRYVFGATNDDSVLGTYLEERDVGIAEAAGTAAKQVAADTSLIAQGIAMMVRGRISFDNVGGPIMLFVIAEKSAKRGLAYFMRIMAMISVNLGLLNLLPIPILDGGHLLFFGIEAIRRRPPSLRTREIASYIGLALLLMLMVLVFKNDIFRYVLG
jgi:regulator of sigma E protease